MILVLLLVFATKAVAECDQTTYDSIYKEILLITLSTDVTNKDMDYRNDTIEILRKLCYGQKSRWEKGQ